MTWRLCPIRTGYAIVVRRLKPDSADRVRESGFAIIHKHAFDDPLQLYPLPH